MSNRTYTETWQSSTAHVKPKILDCTNKLKVYGGSNLKVLGMIQVQVSVGTKSTESNIIIVEDDGPTLCALFSP